MNKIRGTSMRLAFIMAVILLSFMSGALLHAYAGNGSEQPLSASAMDRPAAAGADSVQAVPLKSSVQATVDVCPGDTLWDIARANLPKGESVRSYIEKIKKTNHMKTSDLRSGQILVLP